MEEQKIIITVSGTDKIGIVASVTTVLTEYMVNIEDIKQTLMQGHFVMFLLADTAQSTYSFKEIKQALSNCGEKLGMEVWVQRKEIFDKMHVI